MSTNDLNKNIAVAIRYDGNNAPIITAKGSDAMADLICQCAKEHDIPVSYDPILAQILSHVELGEEIPESIYTAVAEVIAFAYIVSGRVQAVPEYIPKQKNEDKD